MKKVCLPCKAAKRQAEIQLDFFREQAQKRATESDTNYAIYFDTEDKKLRILPFKDAANRGYEIVEFVPRLNNTT